MSVTKRISPSMGVALTALVIALTGGAYAATKHAPTMLTACVHRHGGALYVSKRCAHRDKRLTWGVVGPQGPAGPQGGAGAPGSTGPQGPTGPSTGAAGGALSGTYPNPSLAAWAVTTADLGDGAVTAAKLGAGSVTSSSIATGGLSLASTAVWTKGAGNIGGSTVANGSCEDFNFGDAPASAQASDTVVPIIGPSSPATFLPAPGMFPTVHLYNDAGRVGVEAGVCNLSGAAETLPNPFELSFDAYR